MVLEENLTSSGMLQTAYQYLHTLLYQVEAELAHIIYQLAYDTFYGPTGLLSLEEESVLAAAWKKLMGGLAYVGHTSAKVMYQLPQIIYQLAFGIFCRPSGADGFSAEPAAFATEAAAVSGRRVVAMWSLEDEAVLAAAWKSLMGALAIAGHTGEGLSDTGIQFTTVPRKQLGLLTSMRMECWGRQGS